MRDEQSLPNKNSPVKLSLVVSFYKRDDVLFRTIEALCDSLEDTTVTYELIVVLNGGYLRSTVEKLKQSHFNCTKILAYRGHTPEGFAVKYGMLNAVGEYICFLNLKAPITLVPDAISMLNQYLTLEGKPIVTVTTGTKGFLKTGLRSLVQNIFLGLNLDKPIQVLTAFRRPVLQDAIVRTSQDEREWDTELLVIATALNNLRLSELSIDTPISSNLSVKSLVSLGKIVKNLYFKDYYTTQTMNKFNEVTLKYLSIRVSDKIVY